MSRAAPARKSKGASAPPFEHPSRRVAPAEPALGQAQPHISLPQAPRVPAGGPGRATVFVVDDQPVFREGLIRAINQEKDLVVCGETGDASEALERVGELRPALVILDISLEGVDGIDLTRALREGLPTAAILVVSTYPESLYGERALRAGANGYAMKRESARTLVLAMRHVLDGKTHVSEALNELILKGVSNGAKRLGRAPVDRLSDRERQVFELIGHGLGTREIAGRLNLSMKTVETHREHIKEKLDLDRTTALVQRAIDWVHHRRS